MKSAQFGSKINVWIAVLLVVCFKVWIIAAGRHHHTDRRSLREIIKEHSSLTKFKRLLKREDLMRFVARNHLTIFAPHDSCFEEFPERWSQTQAELAKKQGVRSFLKYHMVKDNLTLSQDAAMFPWMSAADQLGQPYLYINTFSKNGTKIFTINDQLVLTNTPRTTYNGNLYVLQCYLYPLGTTMTSSEYGANPIVSNLSFTNAAKSIELLPEINNLLNTPEQYFTLFTTNDSAIDRMPPDIALRLLYDVDRLTEVYKAHIIERMVLFTPALEHMQMVPAIHGTVHIQRVGNDYFVSNRNIEAKVIRGNIPVSNGVIHVLDDVIYFDYQSVIEELDTRPELSMMTELIRKTPEISHQIQSVGAVTLFVPQNSAFLALPAEIFNRLQSNNSYRQNILAGHVIAGQHLDLLALHDLRKMATASGARVSVKRSGADTFVTGTSIKAKVFHKNIGCNNGIFHILNEVLHIPRFSLTEQIDRQKGLALFGKWWRETKGDLYQTHDPPYSVFAPSDEALSHLTREKREFLLEQPQFMAQVVKAHVIAGQRLVNDDLRDLTTLETAADTTLEVFMSDEGDVGLSTVSDKESHPGRVLRPEKHATDGVLHKVDSLLYAMPNTLMECLKSNPFLRRIYGLINGSKSLQHFINKLQNYSILLPEDIAFNAVSPAGQRLLKNQLQLKKILMRHIIPGRRIDDIKPHKKTVYVKNLLNDTIKVKVSSPDTVITMGYIRALVLQQQKCWGVTLFTIGSFLDPIIYTVYQQVQFLPQLRRLRDVLNGTSLEKSLRSGYADPVKDGVVTLLAPYNDAVMAWKQRCCQSNVHRYAVEKVFNGHILSGVKLHLSSEKSRVHYSKAATVTFQPSLSKGIVVTYMGDNSNSTFNVLQRNIEACNGVIHIVDGVLRMPLGQDYGAYTASSDILTLHFLCKILTLILYLRT